MSLEFEGKSIKKLTRSELLEALASFGIEESDVGSGYVSKDALLETLEFVLKNDDEAFAEIESDFEFLEEEEIDEEHEASIQPRSGERV